jgi:hypothetical protein
MVQNGPPLPPSALQSETLKAGSRYRSKQQPNHVTGGWDIDPQKTQKRVETIVSHFQSKLLNSLGSESPVGSATEIDGLVYSAAVACKVWPIGVCGHRQVRATWPQHDNGHPAVIQLEITVRVWGEPRIVTVYQKEKVARKE